MPLRTTLTGSFPPVYDVNEPIRDLPIDVQEEVVKQSIDRAVQDQIELGIDIVVDGQPRDDIVSLFCKHIAGFSGNEVPYTVTGKIRPSDQPITLADYLYATSLVPDKKLKAHLTGPMTLARDAVVDMDSGYSGKTDPKLIRDIADAIGQEAKFLVQGGAEIIQIDEPVLTKRVDLDLALDMIRRIVEIAEIPTPALHACGNVSMILDNVLTRSATKIISIEGSWLRTDPLLHINNEYLKRCNKQLALGCVSVTDYSMDKLRSVVDFVAQMVTKLGSDNIWAITPNCGLRPMPYEIAKGKLKILTDTARQL